MKVLVTGFDPFGGELVNPAYEAVKQLPDEIAGAQIIKREIPTVFGEGAHKVEQLIKETNPDIVLNIGQAGGRSVVCVEKIGINLAEARIPDNAGNQPMSQSICEDGENAYFTTVPVNAMVENMKSHGIPAGISYTAGTYVCNDVMYRVSHLLKKEGMNRRSGFIHVPYAAEQVVDKPIGTASMSLPMISKAIGYAIEAIVKSKEDIKTVTGEIM